MVWQENVSLKTSNTFGIDVRTKFLVEIHSINDLTTLRNSALFNSLPTLILGGGSNVLFTKNFEGIIIKNCIRGIHGVKENKDYTWIEAGAGEKWHHFVLYCIENNLQGVENLSLIPGTVGAAPMQNIGAYGVEIKDVFESLRAVEIETGVIKTFSKEECMFGYRESIFKTTLKNKYIITSVTFRLNKVPLYNTSYGSITEELVKKGIQELTPKAISSVIIDIRKRKLPDPNQIGNAGSFFKNPEVSDAELIRLKMDYPAIPNYPLPNHNARLPAGWLIEQCGYKGKRFGDAGVHKDQALVLVNYNDATGSELVSLSNEIMKAVYDRFKIEIVPEVNIC